MDVLAAEDTQVLADVQRLDKIASQIAEKKAQVFERRKSLRFEVIQDRLENYKKVCLLQFIKSCLLLKEYAFSTKFFSKFFVSISIIKSFNNFSVMFFFSVQKTSYVIHVAFIQNGREFKQYYRQGLLSDQLSRESFDSK